MKSQSISIIFCESIIKVSKVLNTTSIDKDRAEEEVGKRAAITNQNSKF